MNLNRADEIWAQESVWGNGIERRSCVLAARDAPLFCRYTSGKSSVGIPAISTLHTVVEWISEGNHIRRAPLHRRRFADHRGGLPDLAHSSRQPPMAAQAFHRSGIARDRDGLWLHNLQRMAQYRDPRKLGLYGIHADASDHRLRTRAACTVAHNSSRRLLVGSPRHKGHKQISQPIVR